MVAYGFLCSEQDFDLPVPMGPTMMMLKSDLYKLLSSVLDGKHCLPIYGLEDVEKIENVKIFHAGTKKEGNIIISDGGRILGVNSGINDGRGRENCI